MDDILRVPPYFHQGKRQPVLYLIVNSTHEGIGGKEHQSVAMSGFHQPADLLRQTLSFLFAAHLRSRQVVGDVKKAVFFIVKGRNRNKILQPLVHGQPHDLFCSFKAATSHEGAGGQDSGDVLQPQRPAQLLRHLPAGGAEAGTSVPVVLNVEDVFAIPGKKEAEGLLCCSQPVKKPLREVWGKLFLKLPEEGKAIPKGRFPIRR